MPIQGITKDVDLLPRGQGNMDDAETFVPFHIELRNGHLTEAKNWRKRPGYSESRDTGENSRVRHLIPGASLATSYAVVNQTVYSLGTTPASIGTGVNGASRPISVHFRTTSGATDTIIIVDGGTPKKIQGGTLSDLGGSPVSARFAISVDSRLILSGHNDLDFVWSQVDDAENFPAANVNSVLGGSNTFSETIQMMSEYNREIYFWKDRSMEIWRNVGGTDIFARRAIRGRGTEAGYSVVQADNTFYWLGHDYEFYRLEGDSPVQVGEGVMSFSDEIRALQVPTEVYGIHFQKEKLIRWFAPTDSKCFVYDYVNQVFSKDNGWSEGERFLPIYSYMEVGPAAYIGDYNATGKVYEWSRDHKTDNGDEIRVQRHFNVPLSPDGRDSRVNLLRFRMKRGVATATETSPELMVRWRFDQGIWTPREHLDMGVVGDRYPYADIRQLGVGKEIELDVTETDAVDCLLTNMLMTVRPLGR